MSKESDEHDEYRVLIVNVMKKRNVSEYVRHAKENKIDLLTMNEFSFRETDERDENIYVSESNDAALATFRINDRQKVKKVHVSNHQIVVKLFNPSLMITFWYIPPGQNRHTELVSKLGNQLNRPTRRMIHTGDLNAHSMTTGDKRDDLRGREIVTALAGGHFHLINDYGRPTFRRGQFTSIIDWTMVSTDLKGRVKWELQPSAYGSDHEFVLLTISARKEEQDQQPEQKIKPAAFLKAIKASTIEKNYNRWHIDYNKAVEEAKRAAKRSKKQEEDDGFNHIREEIRRLSKKIKVNDGSETRNREQIKELSTLLNKAVEQSRRNSNYQKRKNATDKNVFRDLVKKTTKTTGCKFVQIGEERLQGTRATDALAEKFFSQERYIKWILPSTLPRDDPPFTHDEVRRTIKSFNKNKAPGRSGVSMALISQWFTQDSEYILGLMNDWFKKGIFPEELKETIVKPILKNLCKSSELSNIRPIALSECLARAYEKLIDKRLMYQVESRKLLSEDQFGYREGRNAIQAAERIMEQRIRNQKGNEMVVQLDVQSAFDSVNHLAIIRAILEMKLPGNLTRIISDYMMNRRITVRLGSSESTRMMTKGVPQGSCLGPHLYVIATNAMLMAVSARMERSKTTRSKITSYADDIIMTVGSTKAQSHIQGKVTEYLDLIAQKLSEIGLKLSTEKTKVMITGKSDPETVRITGKWIGTSEHLKLLGLWFSHDQSFEKHVEETRLQIDDWFARQAGLFSPRSGLSQDLRRKVIIACMHSKALYGAEIWWPKIKTRQKNMVRSMSTKGSRAMVMAPREAGYVATTILSRKLPLDAKCEQRALDHVKLNHENVERTLPSWKLGHPATIKKRSWQATVSTAEEVDLVEAEVKYFTDGSLMKNGEISAVGAAFVRYTAGLEPEVCLMKLDSHCTVFQAEVQAIKATLEDILQRANFLVTYAIFSDSQAALEAITGDGKCTQQVLDCRKWIDEIEKAGTSVKLIHVKAHVGVPGNEQADVQAKRAIIEGDEERLPIPKATIRAKTREEVIKANEEYMEKSISGRTIKQFFSGPSDPQLKKITITADTAELYTGHGKNKQSHYFGYRSQDVKCPCGKVQSVPHLLHDCNLMEDENVKCATSSGIKPQEYFGDWNTLTRHKHFHRYVANRAYSLKKQIENLNHDPIMQEEMYRQLRSLRFNDKEITKGVRTETETTFDWSDKNAKRRRASKSSRVAYSDQGAVNDITEVRLQTEEANQPRLEHEQDTSEGETENEQ